MPTNPHDAAVGCPGVYGDVNWVRHEPAECGLTIRETMAMHIMAGAAANPLIGGIKYPGDTPDIKLQIAIEDIAAFSVKWADALIAALNAKEEAK